MRSVALLLILAGTAHAAERREDFAYGAPIVLEQSDSTYQAALPADVYRRAVYSDLRDLRVFNGSGEIVPFSLRQALPADTQRQPSVGVPIFPLRGDADKALDALRVTITRDGGSVNVHAPSTTAQPAPVVGYFIDLREQKQPIVAVELMWPESTADFTGAVTIAGSDDLSTWHTLVGNAPIVNLKFAGQRLVQRRAEFSASHAKFLRLDWGAHAPAVSFDAASVEPLATRAEAQRLSAEAIGTPVSGGYEFDIGLQAPVDRLSAYLPEPNSLVQVKFWSRPTSDSQWRLISQTTVYRLQRDDHEIESAATSISPTTDRYWRMTVESKSGMGEGSPRLRVSWIPSQLFFIARGSAPFNLAVGNNLAERAEAPLDQITDRRTSETNSIIPATARIGDFVAVGGSAKLTQARPPNWKNWALWIVLVVGVAMLGYMARRLLSEMGKKDSSL